MRRGFPRRYGRAPGAAARGPRRAARWRGRGFGAFFALLQAGAGFGELGFLAGLGGERIQFGGGVAEEVFLAAGGGDGGAGRLQPLGGGAPGAVADREVGAQIGRGAERIEQAQMAGRVGEAHLVVLALHFDQHLADLFEGGGADRRIVHPGAAAAVALHGAAQGQVVLRGQA